MASLCKNLRLARHGANYISHRIGGMRTFTSNRPPLLTKPHLQVKSQSSTARFLAPRAFHNITPQTGYDEPQALIMERNKAPPAHYLVQVDLFSMFDKLEVPKYEIGIFEAGGYKWSLAIYPDGNGVEENNDVGVKLALADTSALPKDWEVDAVFSICLKNQTDGYYHSVLGRAHFDTNKTECGGFIPKHFLTNPSYGFLENDTCVFGAEVYVNKKDVVTEFVSLENLKPPPYKQEFKIQNFPSLKEDGGWVSYQTWTSQVFSAGGHEWKLKVSPRGWEDGTGRLSIFLENVVDSDRNDDMEDESHDKSLDGIKASHTNASYTITLKSQYDDDDDVKYTGSGRFSASGGDHWGWHSFIDLVSLNDPDKGFILNNCVHLELELSVDPQVFQAPLELSGPCHGL